MANTIPNSATAYQDYLAKQKAAEQRQTGGVGFLAALQKALTGADPQNTTLRAQEQSLAGQQFTEPTRYRQELVDSGITDPYKRQALLDQRLGSTAGNLTGVRGKIQDLGASRQQAVDTAGRAYDADTQVSMQQANSAGDFFKQLFGRDLSRQESDRNRKLDLRDYETKQQIESRYRAPTGGGSGIKDRLLTVSEAKTFGVPFGSRASDVVGRDVPQGNTTSYDRFIKDANLQSSSKVTNKFGPAGIRGQYSRSVSVDPRVEYQNYLEAQQSIDSNPANFETIRKDPRAKSFSHLLKPKSSNPLLDALAGIMGGIDTTQ